MADILKVKDTKMIHSLTPYCLISQTLTALPAAENNISPLITMSWTTVSALVREDNGRLLPVVVCPGGLQRKKALNLSYII